MHYPAGGGNFHQGVLLPLRGVLGLQLFWGFWCQDVKWHPYYIVLYYIYIYILYCNNVMSGIHSGLNVVADRCIKKPYQSIKT